MENCKDLKRLFGPLTIRIIENQPIDTSCVYSPDGYCFKGEVLCFHDTISNIKAIYEYTNDGFHLLYKRPVSFSDIQTGDFICNYMGNVGVVVYNKIYYEDGGFDLLSSVLKDDSYIIEIRRPVYNDAGFAGYSKMPVIWSKN